jgi:UDP-2-acetamido-3-amino-2,3-dideoxy-glucuronate N-acetyltransferase
MTARARVDRTADVEKGARLGAGTVVWRHTHVMAGASIGARCVFGQSCFVASTAKIGDGCRIQNHVSLYDGVELEEDVFVGPSAVFTNVKRPRAAYPRKPSYETTRVGRGATIGANATIVCGVTIGPFALVGAGAVVAGDVPAHAIAVGVPARIVGYVCACGERKSTGPKRPLRARCAACGIGPGS